MPPLAPEIVEITLERTPCYGTCPVYMVSFRRDGTARYEGRAFVTRIGHYEGRIRTRTFDRLAELAVASGFFRLRSSYFQPITDCPSAITTVVARERRKTVDNYAQSGPSRLEEFERAIDAAARRVRWRPTAASAVDFTTLTGRPHVERMAEEWLRREDGAYTGAHADDTPVPHGPRAGLGGGVGAAVLEVPPAVQRDVDAVVAALHAERSAPESFERLCTWMEEDDDAASLSREQELLTALAPRHLHGHLDAYWDDDVRDALGLGGGARVTNADRVRFFEECRLPALLEDGDISSAFAAVGITATDGRRAVVVSDVQGYSFSGVTTTWYGPYLSFDEFRGWLDAEGWLFDLDAFHNLPLRKKLRYLRD